MNETAKLDAPVAQALMEQFFHAAVDMFFIADRRGDLRRLNPAWQRTLGHAEAALIGRGWRRHIHPDDVGIVAAAMRALGRGEAIGAFRIRFKAASGDWRWLEWTPAPPSGDGSIQATVRDVTDAEQARVAVEEIEDCAGIGRWEIEPERGVARWSQMTHLLLGTDPDGDDLGPDGLVGVFASQAQAAAQLGAAMQGLATQGTGFRLELPLTGPDGKRRRMRVTGAAEMRGDRPARLYGTVEDVTHDHEVWSGPYRLANIALRTTNLLVVVTDAARRITWVNPAFEQFTGYAMAEVTGRSPGSFLQSEDTDPDTVQKLRAAFAAGQPVRLEIQNRTKSGVAYWVDLDIQPIRDARGELTGFIAMQSDITARKTLEGALRAERNRLRATLEAMPDLVMELNDDGYYTGFHSSGVTEAPVPPDLFLGRTPEDAFDPAVAAVFRKALAETGRSGRSDPHEFQTLTPEGERSFELSASRRPVERPGDEPGYVLVLRDISQRVRQQRSITRTTELFKGLFDRSPIAIVLCDLETGAFLDVNQAYEEMVGLTKDQLLAADPATMAGRLGWGDSLWGGTAALVREGRYGPTDVTCQRADGTSFAAQVRSLLLDDADGRLRVWTFIEDISSRLRREEERERLMREASEARTRLEDALSVLPDGFVYFDADDRLVMCNDRYREFYPLSAEAMVPGAKFEDILRLGLKRGQHPAAIGREEDWLADRLRGRRSAINDLEQQLFDGRWLRVIERRTPEGGRVGMRIDITALKNAEARLASIIEGARVGIWEWSSVTNASVCNLQWAQMLDRDWADVSPLPGERWREIVHPDDLPQIDRTMTPVLARETDRVEYEYRMRHSAGHWVWVLTRARATWQADGTVRIAGVNLDISERKLLEATLETERDYLTRLMETSISGIIAVDAGGRILFANREAEAILDLARAPGPAESYRDPAWRIEALDGSAVAASDLPSQRVLNSGDVLRDLRYAIIWPDGRRRALSVNAAPISQPGLGARVVCSITDITERLEGEAALREAAERAQVASRTKSQFLANMSHEIRTPLNGVLGMAEILHDLVTDSEQLEMVRMIRESGETLLGVLNDILDLSKIEAGKLSLESALFRPTDLVGKIEAMHGLMAREKGLQLAVYTSTTADRRRLGDPHRLMQILHNLVGNAVKFTDAGTVRLILRAEPRGPLHIEVTDTGIGMSADQLRRIFDDFEQADGSMTRRYGGTGLGMSIVRRLIDMMGGTVRVKSAPGQGTSVFVELPMAEADDTVGEDGADPSATTAMLLDGVRILAAEDSDTNRQILAGFLAAAGAEVTLVEHGAAALEAWRSGAFDVLLLDISMPVMDGLSALAALQQATGGNLPPSIAITANAMTHQVETIRAAGFCDHVSKPFSARELVATISRAVANREA